MSHPLVRLDTETGTRAIFFAKEIGPRVEGMSLAASDALIECLADHATREAFQYRHEWAEGDPLIWDYLATLHRATPFDADRERRLLYRAMVSRLR